MTTYGIQNVALSTLRTTYALRIFIYACVDNYMHCMHALQIMYTFVNIYASTVMSAVIILS